MARRDLGDDLIGKIQAVIKSSVQYGLENRDETLVTMRQHAQEFDDSVLMSHVDLYVNQWTVELGEVGSKALKLLSKRARDSGLVSGANRDIEVWSAN